MASTPEPASGERLSLGRDGLPIWLFALMLGMLVSGILGAHRVFAYALVTLLGTFAAMGFVRRRDRLTWLVPAVSTGVLFLGMTGVLLNEHVVVGDRADTVLGFHPATAYLVYAIWIPAYFTVGVTFALLFDRLERKPRRRRRPRRGAGAARGGDAGVEA